MLKDSEFIALIKLLDDADPEVRQIAHARLSELGAEGMPRLEAAADEIGDPEIREQILALIQNVNTEHIAVQLMNWRKAGGDDLPTGWNHLTLLHSQDMNQSKILNNEIIRLSNKIWLEMNEQMYVYEKLRIFNHVFFVMEGYALEKDRPELPKWCFPEIVVKEKKGGSQSLCLLYLSIAHKLELPLAGVILPGYSVLYCHDNHNPFYIDVAGGGNFVSREGLETFVKKLNVPDQAAYYKPTSHIFLILNLIEILRKAYYASGAILKAQQIEDIQQKIDIRLS